MTNQIFEIYCTADYESRKSAREAVNKKIEEGWVVKEMTGIGGRQQSCPALAVLYEKFKPINNPAIQ